MPGATLQSIDDGVKNLSAGRAVRAAVMLALVALALGAAGCNSDDGDDGADRGASATEASPKGKATPATDGQARPADVKEIRAVVVRLFKSSDVRWICERSLTPRLFGLLYADGAACRKAAADEEDDKPPKRVEVSGIETRGNEATARARLVGGDTGGAAGALSLRKGGDGWRLDDLSTPFLRSLTAASLRNDNEVPNATGRCIEGRLTRMSDGRFKRFSFGLLGRKPRASARLLELWSECERGRGRVSSLRRPLEKAIVEQLRRARANRRVSACVVRRLRSTLPDKLLIELSTADDRRSKVRLNREVVAAAIACGFQPRSDPGRGLSPA